MSQDQKPPSVPPVQRQRSQTIDRLWADVEKLIAGSHLFRCLDDAGREALLQRGRLMLFPAGTVIVREGEPGDSFFVIDQGVVEVVTQSSAGEISLTTLQRGAFFGEVSVLTNAMRTATVTALTDTATVAFERKDVDELLSSNPKAKRLLDAVMNGRARDTAEKVAKASLVPPDGDGT
ncbi:MAG: cyclic nucleotide-binding domain-containing protein [Deltaproteobacteria bacterium]